MYGTLGAAWPLVRDDLGLTYAEIGLALAIPGFVGSALDPLVGVLGDTGRRRFVMVLGGAAFAVSAALVSASAGFWMLVVALVVANPASGALVSLAQATLMDLAPAQRDRNMARWTLAGSFGYVGGPPLYLALYFVDVARTDAGVAAVGVAVWTGAGLLGDWLLLSVLRRIQGRRYLRASAVVTLAVYPAFLLVPGLELKLVLVAVLGLLNAGWYAIPKAGLYEALPGRSGAAVAVGGVAGLVGSVVPLVLGFVAGAVGLAPTMWILLLAPVALLALVPSR